MADFAPSIEAARQAVSTPIVRGELPVGLKGAKFSIEEVAKRVREGSRDPRIIGWAGRALIEAGRPKSIKDRAQAILDAVRAKTMYVPDPVGAERITAGKHTLCLDELGLCMPAGDCDDLTVATASAIMAVGIPVQVVAQSFDDSGAPGHVLLAVEISDGKWDRVDPSSSKFRVGEYYPAKKEWWFDPLKEIKMDDAGHPVGDYVGVGRTPEVGLAQYQNVVLQIPGATNLTDSQKSAIYEAATGQLQIAVGTLASAVDGLERALEQITKTRAILRPDRPFDPDSGSPVTSVGEFPHDGTWTKNMSEISWWLVGVGKKFVAAGREALNGGRKIFVDRATQDAYVEGNSTDTFRLNTVRKVGDAVLAFVNPVGSVVAGLTAREGRVLTKEETERELLAARGSGLQGTGLGVAPAIVVVAVIAGVVVVSLAAMYIVKEWCHSAETAAKEATRTEMMRAVANGKLTPEQAEAIERAQSSNRIAEEKAKGEHDMFASFAKAMMYMAIGGGVIAGAYVAAPAIKAAAEKWSAK